MKANYADILHVRAICFFICFERSFYSTSLRRTGQLYITIINCPLSIVFLKIDLFLFGNIFLFVPFYFSGHIHDYTQYDE